MNNSTNVGRRVLRARRTVLFISSALCSGMVLPAIAQTTQGSPPPLYSNVDDLGIDMTTGQPNITFKEGSIGPDEGGIAFVRTWVSGAGWTDNWTGGAFRKTVGGVATWYVEHGPQSETFLQSGSAFVNQQGTGSTLTGSVNGLTYTARDGTVTTYTSYNFDPTGTISNESSCSGDQGTCLLPSKITRPNGLTYTFSWDANSRCPGSPPRLECGARTFYRLTSITSSYGYQLTFAYASNSFTGSAPSPDWFRKVSSKYTNTVVSCGTACPTVTYPNSTSYVVITPSGRQWEFSGDSGAFSRIRKPGSSADDVTIGYDANGHVSSASITDLGTWGYNFTDSGATRTAIATDPLGHTRTVVSDLTKGRPTSATNGEGKTTSYTYDANGRVYHAIAPDGGYTQFTYDARGNVTERRQVSKTSGTPADIVTTASFPNCLTVSCNEPDWTKDANGNQTNYTYDTTTGNVLTVAAPAPNPAVGTVRPTKTYGYTVIGGVQLPSSISTCRTSASCAGTADETKVTIGYNSNLLPASVTSAAGDGSLTATNAIGYDAIGNRTSVDGPLAGAGDTTTYRYDAERELVGTVSADPDGAGPHVRRATRVTYSARGRPTLTEAGTVTDATDAAWANFSPAQAVATTYDDDDRKLTDTLSAAGTVYGVTQYSYDHQRLDCVAVRMNGVGSGCTPQTTSDGSDRIVKYGYDRADRVTMITSGYGTTDAANDVTKTLTNDGQIATAADANGNLTTYEYDGFDRPVRVHYPVPGAAGSSSTTDYEEVVYDPASNILSHHLRGYAADNTQHIDYSYNALNQMVTKDVPNVAWGEKDVTYSYDLLGHLTQAVGAGWMVNAFGYDALGRLVTDQKYDETLAYQYDAAGHRTRMTWADGFYVAYDYDTTGNMTAIRENGATSGAGMLATFAYDDLGRRTSLTRGNGVVTSYGFDPVSRLASLTNDLAGTAQDLTLTFAYNPAGQITSRTASNDAYAWTGAVDVDRNYAPNGLNQYTSAGSTAFGYDARGNLVNSGGTTFTYTSENRLATNSTGVFMTYEPAGGELLELGLGSSDRRFVTSAGQIVDEIEATTGQRVGRYVFGPGADEPLVSYDASGNRSWLIADERGSIVAKTDASGTAVAAASYDEYGIPAGGDVGRFGYTGQAWLPELGMSYYKARIYSPTLGRFMQTDPIGYADGMNWYNYTGGDPVNFTDPTGLSDCDSGTPGPDCAIVVTAERVNPYSGGGASLVQVPSNQRSVFGGGGGQAFAALKSTLQRHSSFYCNAKVGLGIGLDIAGTAASAIPGTGQALVLTQLGLSGASALYSGVTHNSQGTAVAGAAYGLTLGGLEASGKTVERAIPVVGALLGAAQTYSDVKTAQEDYEKCLRGD